MRWSRPKNESRSGVVGGSEVKSISAHLHNFNNNLTSSNVLLYRLVVNKGTLTVKNQGNVFASRKMTILNVIRGVGGKFLSLPIYPHPSHKNKIKLYLVENNHKCRTYWKFEPHIIHSFLKIHLFLFVQTLQFSTLTQYWVNELLHVHNSMEIWFRVIFN